VLPISEGLYLHDNIEFYLSKDLRYKAADITHDKKNISSLNSNNICDGITRRPMVEGIVRAIDGMEEELRGRQAVWHMNMSR